MCVCVERYRTGANQTVNPKCYSGATATPNKARPHNTHTHRENSTHHRAAVGPTTAKERDTHTQAPTEE